MEYYLEKKLKDITFEDAISKVTEALKGEGFGVLTEIDVQTTLKKKLDVDFRNYRILGACNPPFAYLALQSEPHIGLMLPCNVAVQQVNKDEISVSAIDPLASMHAVDNRELLSIADEIRIKLQKVINSL